jgi:hypothetical protein
MAWWAKSIAILLLSAARGAQLVVQAGSCSFVDVQYYCIAVNVGEAHFRSSFPRTGTFLRFKRANESCFPTLNEANATKCQIKKGDYSTTLHGTVIDARNSRLVYRCAICVQDQVSKLSMGMQAFYSSILRFGRKLPAAGAKKRTPKSCHQR